MVEKVNPSHPDKIADRIAGAIVDLAYTKSENPKVAVEVLIGHGECNVIIETSENIVYDEVRNIVDRISPSPVTLNLNVVPQDIHLADNQTKISCGDNGIFKGVPLTEEEMELSEIAREIYQDYPYDGKYILDKKKKKLVICQSHLDKEGENILRERYSKRNYEVVINPLGEWEGGTDVDTGAINRKLGSDMAQSVTGGGPHGKDLSKADVTANIWAFTQAQIKNRHKEYSCSIGDTSIDDTPYELMVEFARGYIQGLGGFEAFAEWGLF